MKQDEWVLFLESHLGLWEISQSKIMVEILKQLGKGYSHILALYLKMPAVPMEEIGSVLEVFVSTGLASKSEVSGLIVYRPTQLGRDFLEKYTEAEKNFTIK